MDLNPKKIVRSNSTEDSLSISNREEVGKDDDDPLSIKDVSSTLIGFILAFMTLFLPAISVFFERPFLPRTGLHNQMVNKDGY